MNTAERIFEEVQTLPEPQAREVLDFVGFLKTRRLEASQQKREAALATLAQYRGRFHALKFNREELHDRPGLC